MGEAFRTKLFTKKTVQRFSMPSMMSDMPTKISATRFASNGLNTSRNPNTRPTAATRSTLHQLFERSARSSKAVCSLNALSMMTTMPMMTGKRLVMNDGRAMRIAPAAMLKIPVFLQEEAYDLVNACRKRDDADDKANGFQRFVRERDKADSEHDIQNRYNEISGLGFFE